MTTNFRKFSSIERFHNIIKHAQVYPHRFPASMQYRPRVKLHGTNAGIGCVNGEVFAQKRTSKITPEKDNFNFAQFVEERKEKFEQALPDNTWLFGEWVGKGIQKGVALSELEEKVFVVFAVYTEIHDEGFMAVDQKCLDLYVQAIDDPRVMTMPWYTEKTFTVNFFEKESLKQFVDEVNELVEKVENECPFMKTFFNVTGTGEGLVFVPVSNEFDRGLNIPRDEFSKYTFKAKGQKHEVVKTDRKAVELTPEEVKSRNEFVEKFATEARMEQIVQEYCNNDFDMRNMGTFLKQFGLDVQKEARDELEANGLEWKSVIKPVQKAARDWFIIKNRTI